jgi:copper chaperone CopZ
MKPILFKTVATLFFVLCLAIRASAQFENVYIGVNGLTCSQCSRTVEMSIRKLDFVADVQMNLEHTEGKIILKKNKKADMDKVAQAVFNAGFSVRYLQADLHIDNSITSSGSCFSYNGDQYIFTDAPKTPFKGEVKLKFLGKKYMAKNDFKKIESHMNDKCGTTEGKIYHVMM